MACRNFENNEPSVTKVNEKEPINQNGLGHEEKPLITALDQAQLPPFKILSIDGGGVRGIIAARILELIEEKIGKPAFELFDLVAGSSSGGLIALALTHPVGAQAKPPSAKKVKEFFINNAENLFKEYPLGNKLRPIKNQQKTSTHLLDQLVGNQPFKYALKPVLVVTTDIERARGYKLESDKTKFDNLKLNDVALAIFPLPYRYDIIKIHIKNEQNNLQEHYLSAGELYKNNPALLAYEKARDLLGEINMKQRGVILVSIGAGKPLVKKNIGEKLLAAGALRWLDYLIDAMIDGSSNEDEEIINFLFKDLPNSKLIRLQPEIDNLTKGDAISPNNYDKNNIKNLLRIADGKSTSPEFKLAIESLTIAKDISGK